MIRPRTTHHLARALDGSLLDEATQQERLDSIETVNQSGRSEQS